jgi:CDP-paratose 2-epimerase
MIKKALITGASGLIGSEAAEYFSTKFDEIIGIDNDFRKYFFGENASNIKNSELTKKNFTNFVLYNTDIRNYDELEKIFIANKNKINLIIHTAAQPSHDWASKEPLTDYNINSTGTLYLLELTRKYCPDAVFIYTSTNKVYGSNPNKLPFIELEKRWELPKDDYYYNGINETLSIDNTTHSLFGCSKLAADLYVQEYARYFGIKTTTFRFSCLTGGRHNGAELHGFLNYLVKCILNENEYKIFGYKGKQVRCNIHSFDVVRAFDEVYQNPKIGEIYNLGGGRNSNCSILEAIEIIQNYTKKVAKYIYINENRIGDHIWYISDNTKFLNDYPNWKITYNIDDIIKDIINKNK